MNLGRGDTGDTIGADMAAEFRDFLQRLIERGELKRVSEELDLRQLSARVSTPTGSLEKSEYRPSPSGPQECVTVPAPIGVGSRCSFALTRRFRIQR